MALCSMHGNWLCDGFTHLHGLIGIDSKDSKHPEVRVKIVFPIMQFIRIFLQHLKHSCGADLSLAARGRPHDYSTRRPVQIPAQKR